MNLADDKISAPLVARRPASIFAWRRTENSALRPVTTHDFLVDVYTLSRTLPELPVAINLCKDRYRFAVAFCAVIVAGQANALPPSGHVDVQRRTANNLGACYVVHDGTEIDGELEGFLVQELASDSSPWETQPSEKGAVSIPAEHRQIPLEQIAAFSFTSGTTGEPKSTAKSWQTLTESAHLNRKYYLKDLTEPLSIVATVPAQHMYGLETTILLPLIADVAVHADMPLYPADVNQCLNALPGPNVLVSTPVHLRSMVQADSLPESISLCLSATAPLAQDDARAIANRCNAMVREIYGCSEAGSIAVRDPLERSTWTPFDAFRFSTDNSVTRVAADHLLEPVALQDILEFSENGEFSLVGRHADLVNVAGKRGSLAALTETLKAMPGVADGIVFDPSDESDPLETTRLAALVVADTRNPDLIKRWFRNRVDAAFVPRRIVFVDVLPRAPTGKLPRDTILALYEMGRKNS